MTESIEELQEKLKEVTQERNKYHAELVDLRLSHIERTQADHESRIRPLEDGQVKANTIYTLFAGNSLLSIIALIKDIFAMTTKRKPKAKSTRKRGGQPGNKNNLRHGFYQKHYSPEENKRLDRLTDELEIIAEINLVRVYMDRLAEQISFEEVTRTNNNGTEFRDGHYLQQLNTLSAMTTAMTTLIRTHYLTHGRSGDIQSSILQALEELRLEMGI